MRLHRLRTLSLGCIVLFFLAGGTAHFIYLDAFVAIMPDYLDWHVELVIISGLFELLGAIGLALPQTRLLAGYGLMALIVAVYPANIHMALNPQDFPRIPELLLYLRLPLQFLLLWLVWWTIKPLRLTPSQSSSE